MEIQIKTWIEHENYDGLRQVNFETMEFRVRRKGEMSVRKIRKAPHTGNWQWNKRSNWEDIKTAQPEYSYWNRTANLVYAQRKEDVEFLENAYKFWWDLTAEMTFAGEGDEYEEES